VIVQTYEGRDVTLELLIRSGLQLHLYTNDREPARQDKMADYKEMTGGGYAPVKLSARQWQLNQGVAIYPPISFVFNEPKGNLTIYGYYVTLANRLIWAERLPQPLPVRITGDSVTIQPRYAHLFAE